MKAQRIVLDDGEEYSGLWHEDGMNEHVAAVILYYHRASASLQGGALEFCSKQLFTLWKNEDDPTRLVRALPRCQVCGSVEGVWVYEGKRGCTRGTRVYKGVRKLNDGARWVRGCTKLSAGVRWCTTVYDGVCFSAKGGLCVFGFGLRR